MSSPVGQSAYGTSAVSHPSVALKTGTVDQSAEQDFVNKTNALRASLGLGQLTLNQELLNKGRSWSETQAQAGTIFHSTLTDGITQNWHRLGENVGMGPDVASIHDALVRSPRHYENLVDPGFTEVGIGVIRQGDIIYVTQEFMEFMPVTTSTTPAASNTSTQQVGAASATPIELITSPAKAAPLKFASYELSEVIRKLSELEA